jgi:enolase-phosphatase E1
MTVSNEEHVSVALLDIEGTTTPIDFVFRVLFPYASERMARYLRSEWGTPALEETLALLGAEHAAEPSDAEGIPEWASEQIFDSTLAYLQWLIAQDRKSPALKTLQGRIWQFGYESGEIKGALFDDVPAFLQAWRSSGRRVCIYSSGSVLAQQLLFRYSTFGDLTSWIDGYFDTGVGPKRAAASYAQIAQALGVLPGEIRFVSDIPAELDAARAAGLRVALSLRPGNAPVDASGYPALHQLTELIP